MFSNKPLVLVVDDEPIYTEILYELLKERYDILPFGDGESVLAALDDDSPQRLLDRKPNLFLLDVLMPGINGYEVCQRIRAKEAFQHTPIIFLTVKDNLEDELYGFEVGAADYITKPLNPEKVKARVRAHLIQADYRSELEREVEARTREIQRT